MASPVAVRFGCRVAAERRRRGWTISELALKSGVERTVIHNLEHARQGCRLESAVRIATALEITLDGLTGPCERCQDQPPPGFTCQACGARGEEPQRRECRHA